MYCFMQNTSLTLLVISSSVSGMQKCPPIECLCNFHFMSWGEAFAGPQECVARVLLLIMSKRLALEMSAKRIDA
jgi:hypothetical protein